MKTIFNNTVRQELIKRIDALKPDHTPHWGKMDAFQMVKHCSLSEALFLGTKKYERLFIGRLFGKMALKGILKNENPMKKNQPTHPDFKITGGGNFEKQKQEWITLLDRYDNKANYTFVHPFFGTMSNDEIGRYVYKHTDHHLRQFNA